MDAKLVKEEIAVMGADGVENVIRRFNYGNIKRI